MHFILNISAVNYLKLNIVLSWANVVEREHLQLVGSLPALDIYSAAVAIILCNVMNVLRYLAATVSEFNRHQV